MSYQVLARKWRPRNFQEVVGQQHVVTALSNGLAQNRVHHAYLFSGTRGVGKTTIARILAKSLNCEQGVTATPCGQCGHCQAIDQGRFVDLLEIDAASRTKVDDTREMLDNVQYKPAQGRYKVYLIDEVHMLSKHSFNALLKTLEEPPEYVKFLLATTDPQKLPVTVLSRCLQFHLKAILPEEIEKQLVFILQHEHATFDHAALSVIAKAADGSIRDALSLTDQALAFGAGHIDYQSVLKMLGTIDSSHLTYLLHFIVSGNVEKVFQKIQEFVHLGADFAKLHQGLASLCHQIALLQMRNKSTASEKNTLQLLAERLTPEEVQLYYQIALQGYKDYAFAPNGKIALEMTVMRLLAFKPANYIALDESLLKSTALTPSRSTSVADTSMTVDPAVADNLREPDVPQSVEVLPTDQVATVETLKQNEASVESVPALSSQKKECASADANADLAVTHEQSVKEVTHSRNMLRSHRLKREEAKKSQATIGNQNTEQIVAPQIVSEKVTSSELESTSITSITTVADNSCEEQPLPLSYEESLPTVANDWSDTTNIELTDFDDVDAAHSFMPERVTTALPVSTQNTPYSAGEAPVNEQDFFTNESLDLPAIDIGQYVEDKLTDPWSVLIQQMQLVGLVKLLAKNSVMKQRNQQIILTLKIEQQHLLNNNGLCEQLQAKLKTHYGDQMSVYIEVGEDEELTPIECEQRLYQQYLDNAKRAIKEDKNIQTWVRDYGAKIYENSIIPL
ncbi:DNA polymerase III subunit gamma/tau [Psychromonas antarctica]|uniref:DNA polymerase III subunit gamma/tau n=1 Tax=Psychromonas antarctica TaxID=67573 RepID=UPI001EE833BC|nr:DNA polymerase III subunit gamma/tau [Psychromonas antarctica]